ncbi:MAG TPA: heavy-metal-associated domain-containing protein [Candidatus Dormibacteraeota bacterium]|nr:heavy-metal-associated domain-containing protein [Candidatus Dormibacteraeota bacterium]
MSSAALTAADISCDHCKRTIETGLATRPGVRRVEVDVAARVVHVDFDETATDEATLAADLDELGYPVSA